MAIRVTLDTGGQRMLLFDVVGTGTVMQIYEIRSEAGRLSSRLAEEILRQAGDPGPAPNVDAWMTRVTVSSGWAASFCGLSDI